MDNNARKRIIRQSVYPSRSSRPETEHYTEEECEASRLKRHKRLKTWKNSHEEFIKTYFASDDASSLNPSLLMATVEDGMTPFHYVCKYGLQDQAKHLFRIRDTHDFKNVINKKDYKARTIMHYICMTGNSAVFEKVVDAWGDDKEDLNKLLLQRDDESMTPFHYACEGGALDVDIQMKRRIDGEMNKRNLKHGVGTTSTVLSPSSGQVLPDGVSDDGRCELPHVQEDDYRTRSVYEINDEDVAIHIASEEDFTKIVKIILSQYTKPLPELLELKGREHETVLNGVCMSGNVGMFELIVERLNHEELKNVLKLEGRNNATVLHIACAFNQSDIIKVIFSATHKDDIKELIMVKSGNSSFFDYVCLGGFVDVVEKITNSLKTSDLLDDFIMTKDESGMTPLHLACVAGHSEIFGIIVKSLSDGVLEKLIMMQTRSHGTLLHLACQFDRHEVVAILDKKLKGYAWKRMLMLPGRDGELALSVAYENKSYKTLALMLSSKHISFNDIFQSVRQDFLIECCKRGDRVAVLNILGGLVKTGLLNGNALQVCLMAKSEGDQKTVLHIACNRRDPTLVRELINYMQRLHMNTVFDREVDAPTEIMCNTDFSERTVLHDSCLQGDAEIVQMVLDAAQKFRCLKALLLIKTSGGNTTLHEACQSGDIQITQMLLLAAKSVGCVKQLLLHKNTSDRTAFYECCQNNHVQLIQMLFDAAKNDGSEPALLQCGEKTNQTAFLELFENGNNTNIELILNGVSRETRKQILSHEYAKKRTIFHHSCRSPDTNLKCLQTLVRFATADKLIVEILPREDDFKKTFLSYISEAKESVIQLLIRAITDHDIHSNVNNKMFATKEILTKEDITKTNAMTHAQRCQKSHVLVNFLDPFFEICSKQNPKLETCSKQNPELETCSKQNPELEACSKQNPKLETCLKLNPEDFSLLHCTGHDKEYTERKRENILSAIGDSECLPLISHHYTKNYLDICWRKYVAAYFFTNLILYLCLLVSLTCHVISNKWVMFGESVDFHSSSDQSLFSKVAQYLLIVFAVLTALHEGLQMRAKRWHYFLSVDNYPDLCVCVGSLSVAFAPFGSGYVAWVHQLGSAVMCLAWINAGWMMTKIHFKKFRDISHRFIMLFKVLEEMSVFIPVFALFCLAFALVFHSLFQIQDTFSNVGFAIMKVLAMTVGELDFASLFFPDDDRMGLPFYWLSSLLFVLFLGMMTVSAMNLLVAIAVGDISELRSKSEILAFQSQVDITLETQALLAVFEKQKKLLVEVGFRERDSH